MSRFSKSDEELQTMWVASVERANGLARRIINARAELRSGGSREAVIAILDGREGDDA
ncbi:hypothetical protein [Curtobacterium sp. MCLR17_034]|uniref:hypothetical protein n=1 Tax=Curtobacterium sp. MCLR17_034 TaxID=2175623 RepID=UPI0015E8CFAA|nr:hypothetical protein [Curtobacterium sp. MCLR17_034]